MLLRTMKYSFKLYVYVFDDQFQLIVIWGHSDNLNYFHMKTVECKLFAIVWLIGWLVLFWASTISDVKYIENTKELR